MHPYLLNQLANEHINDLLRQAERHRLASSAKGAARSGLRGWLDQRRTRAVAGRAAVQREPVQPETVQPGTVQPETVQP